MNHKYSTFALLLFLLIGGSIFVLGELTSEEVDSIDVTCLKGNSVLYKPSSTMVWQCASLNDTRFNITVDEIYNIYTNQSIYWGNYSSSDYNMTRINQSSTYWRTYPVNNITTDYALYVNNTLIINNWSIVKKDLLTEEDLHSLGDLYVTDRGEFGNTLFIGEMTHSSFDSGTYGGIIPTYASGWFFNQSMSIFRYNNVELVKFLRTIDGSGNVGINQSYGGFDDSLSLQMYNYNISISPLDSSSHIELDGNITTDYYYGDGSKLTGISSSDATAFRIINNSNVAYSNSSMVLINSSITFSDSNNRSGTGYGIGSASKIYQDNNTATANRLIIDPRFGNGTNNATGFVYVGNTNKWFKATPPTDRTDNLVSFFSRDGTNDAGKAGLFVAEWNGSQGTSSSGNFIGLNAIVALYGNGPLTSTAGAGQSGGRYIVRVYSNQTIAKVTGTSGSVVYQSGSGGTPFGTLTEAVNVRSESLDALTGNVIDGYGFRSEGASKSAAGNFTNFYSYYANFIGEGTTILPTNSYGYFLARDTGAGDRQTNGVTFGEKNTRIYSEKANYINVSATNVSFTGGIRPQNYYASNGTIGFTGTCTILGLTSVNVVNGLITGCT